MNLTQTSETINMSSQYATRVNRDYLALQHYNITQEPFSTNSHSVITLKSPSYAVMKLKLLATFILWSNNKNFVYVKQNKWVWDTNLTYRRNNKITTYWTNISKYAESSRIAKSGKSMMCIGLTHVSREIISKVTNMWLSCQNKKCVWP